MDHSLEQRRPRLIGRAIVDDDVYKVADVLSGDAIDSPHNFTRSIIDWRDDCDLRASQY